MLVNSYANFVVAARVADLLQEAMVTLSGWSVSTQDFSPDALQYFLGLDIFLYFLQRVS